MTVWMIFSSRWAFHRDTDLLDCCVRLTGRTWSHEASCDLDRLPKTYLIQLPSVRIARSVCHQLVDDLDGWLECRTPFERYLASSFEQTVTLGVGTREDLITTVEHPAVTFCYDDGRCRLEVFFVVDQSCLRIARDGLSAALLSSAQMPSGACDKDHG